MGIKEATAQHCQNCEKAQMNILMKHPQQACSAPLENKSDQSGSP
jgi:hypothetical protein